MLNEPMSNSAKNYFILLKWWLSKFTHTNMHAYVFIAMKWGFSSFCRFDMKLIKNTFITNSQPTIVLVECSTIADQVLHYFCEVSHMLANCAMLNDVMRKSRSQTSNHTPLHTHTHSQIISWISLFFKNITSFSPHENFTIKSHFNTMAMIQYKKQPICVFLLMVLLVIAIFFIHMVKNRRRIIIRIQLTSLIRFLSRIVIFTILIETIVWADVFVLQLSGFISRLWTIPRSTE